MANKSYAITMSLLRIGVLAGQIAVSPSAAAQSTPRHHDEFLASERTCAFCRPSRPPNSDRADHVARSSCSRSGREDDAGVVKK
jgi:hypothetical protein